MSKNLGEFIRQFVGGLFFKWLFVLIALFGRLLRLFRNKRRNKRRLTRRERRSSKHPCEPLTSESYKRPDPLIYSQGFLMKQGLAVTWDNPDIQLLKNGIPVPSTALESDTEYEVTALIWNNSTEAPAIGLPVRFSYLSFGMGTVATPIAATQVDLGVKGSSQCPAHAMAKWRTPTQPGHYCLQAQLVWADDAEPGNNIGQENTQVGYARSPAVFTFRLHNQRDTRHLFRFELDTYQLPALPECRETIPEERPGRGSRPTDTPRNRHGKTEAQWAQLRVRHDRHRFPLPPGWQVELIPPSPVLDAHQEMEITAIFTPPQDFKGQKTFNVNGFDELNRLAGGVTLSVIKE